MRIQHNYTVADKKLRSQTGRTPLSAVSLRCDIKFKNDRSNDDSIRSTISDGKQQRRSSLVGGRGDTNRDTLREMRRHQRSMKLKYHKNSDSLLYYCFYKGITEKYYDTLREC